MSFIEKVRGNRTFKTYSGTTMALVALIILFSFLSGHFFQADNLMNILLQVSIITILAIGMTFVLMIGEIDLSVASTLALSGVVMGMLINNGMNLVLALIITIVLLGVAVGFFNGYISAKFKLPTFIVTVASMQIIRGIGFALTDAKPIQIKNEALLAIGNQRFLGIIPYPILIMIAIAIIAHIILSKTKYGRQLKMMGGNREAAKYSGIKINKLQISVFVVSAMTAAVSGILMASRLYSAQPNVAQSYELDAIASAVLGGTSLNGGQGTILGTLIGALIIGVVNNGMNLIGLEYFYQQIVKGAIIVIAVLIDVRSKGNK
ncbi:ABC transporter permease [Erysipelothrix sp. HDW6C]|uniref:ABC transporter permease n=1 Tax=Erysipelothrix sp. HDW6C TaxID=2714930 RepID=UPI00140CCCAF|nr:ABC transporter permease [Erysipelothrix sp. HDW6C]QIK70670.1 ABC transporter permease [Erysipelothrix sp. HDW6C]